MTRLVLLAALAALVLAPTLALTPGAHACQPYHYYCPLNGHVYYGCGNTYPPPIVQCLREASIDPIQP